MNYQETIEFLYGQLPMFQRVGGAAYKAGLDTSYELDNLYKHPHKSYKTIHVAGTNGKGSVSHLLASVLQKCGYKVGLYTSPHLIDFRERIRVNGKMISKECVTSFVSDFLRKKVELHPSFFELTMMMAFDYFRKERVDYAVIEVGMGGRLDSTNIITPILSVITNISPDHMQFLGNTLSEIAKEKAGIIKHNVPVVIGEAKGDVRKVFEEKANDVETSITFAEDKPQVLSYSKKDNKLVLNTLNDNVIYDELTGDCQLKNANTVLNAIDVLRKIGIDISIECVQEAFKNVCEVSGLMGRWMIVNDSPRTICDTGHNIGGLGYIIPQLKKEVGENNLHIVLGFVKDKDISHILELFPNDAHYYFTNASIPRALAANELKELAETKGLSGEAFGCVGDAYNEAKKNANVSDIIYVGGSTFVVADFLISIDYEGR